MSLVDFNFEKKTVGFLLLPCSVVCTVGSLSLFCLLFVSWCLCAGRWCTGGFGLFRAGWAFLCVSPRRGSGWGWCRWASLGPQIFFWSLWDGASFVDLFYLFMFHFCLCCAALSVPCDLVVACWERACLLAFLCLMCFGFSHVVSHARCGSWLYRFLIFTFFFFFICVCGMSLSFAYGSNKECQVAHLRSLYRV